jgi:prophage regulatory protein
MTADVQPPIRFVRFEDVIQETALSETTIRNWIKAGKFPRPRRIGPRASAFLRHEIEEWKAARPIQYGVSRG